MSSNLHKDLADSQLHNPKGFATASNSTKCTKDASGNLVWAADSGGGGGSGTVTSITAGTGLDGGTITTAGTIDLANTAVTAGSYTNADVTIDAQGRITAAANGSSGGSESIMTKGDVLPCGGFAGAGSYTGTTLTARRFYAVPFWVGGSMSVTHIGLDSSASIAHDIYGGIYKYSLSSDEWTKVVQVGAFTTGVTGKQSIALGSTEVLTQGIYAMVIHANGGQTNLTGHYVQTLQNILPAFQTSSLNANGFYLYQSIMPTSTLPATLTNASFSVFPYSGHLVASCYLTLG